MPSTTSTTGTPINGSIALVTGGNRGLGRALVAELLSRGAAKVYATARSLQSSDDARIVPLTLDVTDESSVQAAAAAAQDVSIVINNAGVSLATPLLSAPLADIRAELETNLFGILRVTRAFAPILSGRAPTAIVNVLSVLSWLAKGSGYEVSKAAAWSATNSLRVALHDQGTTVTAVHVGYMDTDMTAHLQVPKAAPEAVAVQTVEAIASGAYEVQADEVTKAVKSTLSGDLTSLYTELTSR